MLLIEFAESRNEKADTIRKYINRHKKEFEGLCSFSGAKMELNEKAVELLDKIYPLPRPIEIIEDTESRRKLIQLQEAYIQLQAKMVEATTQLAQAEATKLLLEDKEEQLEKAEQKLLKAEEKTERVEIELKELREKSENHIKELEEQLEIEKSKTWLQKLLKK